MMDKNVEQTQAESAPIHSPSDWAKRLVESSKPADMEEQTLAPQEELSEEDVIETEADEPTSLEAHDEEETEDDVVDALEEETEATEEADLSASIIADGVYMIDGQEVSGQEVLNGLEATRNFGEEKHRLRVEAQDQLDADRGELFKKRDDYAAGLSFMLGISQQSQQKFANVNWVMRQQENPAEYQRAKTEQGAMIANQQQLQGQFDQFLHNAESDQAEEGHRRAAHSLAILKDRFEGEDGWSKRYPELRRVADKEGWKADEFNKLTDHRLMVLLDKVDAQAKQLAEFEIVARKKTGKPVKEKRRNGQRVNTVATRNMTDAHDQFMKTRSPKDAARMLMQQSQAGPKGRNL